MSCANSGKFLRTINFAVFVDFAQTSKTNALKYLLSYWHLLIGLEILEFNSQNASMTYNLENFSLYGL